MRQQMRKRRLQLGLSQQQAADRAGLSRGNYAHIERGRHEPSIEQMEAIAKALEIDNPLIIFFKNHCDELYQKEDDDTVSLPKTG